MLLKCASLEMERLFLVFSLAIAIAIICSKSTFLGCNGQENNIKCLPSDREALLDFKDGLVDPENTLSSWRGLDCCVWKGILCDNITGGVTTIDLHNPNSRYYELSGEIRPSLMKLRSLIHLDLSFNAFEEIPIPEFVGSLRNLRYLDLSNAGFSGIIPPNLGNLSNLQYLDVSDLGFSSLTVSDFQWIKGLVSLRYLDMNNVDLSLVHPNWLEMVNTLLYLKELHLSGCSLPGSISSLGAVNFTSLSVIDLSFNGFGSTFPGWVVNISSLEYIDFSFCMLRGRIPLGLGELLQLRFLNLGSNNNLSASALSLFNRTWKSIEVLNLASNKLHGELPRNLGNMSSLRELNLFVNEIEGGIPSTIGSLCNLANFDMSGNKLTGSLPQLLEGTEKCGTDSPLPSLVNLTLSNNNLSGILPDWLGQIQNLEKLSLSFNLFEGHIPASLRALRKLSDLSLAGNKLNGTLPEGIGGLSELSVLDVSSNYLTETLSETHFSKLSKLKILRLSSNSFTLNVSSNWLPPFQIRNLDMGSCHLGPSFPPWLKSQNEIRFLDISNASISDSIPIWFWDLTSNLSLINVSFNQITGEIPRSFKVTPFADIDFSSNLLEGHIPLPSVQVELFDLSNNRFQGSIPENISNVMTDLIFLSLSGNNLSGEIPADIGNMVSLQVIDLSRNNLMGAIPQSIGNCTYLKVLDLAGNNLSGAVPSSLGQLRQLQSLHLNDNLISGELPSSLKNLSSLETLDLGHNNFNGSLPLWLGEGFTDLRILKLRSNAFYGDILFEFANMSSLQVLDLAENNLTGRIPTTLGQLKAMTQEKTVSTYLLYGRYRGLYYEENLVVSLKNQQQKFTKTLSFLTAIDLSGNNLSGGIPVELTNLRGLVVLNLSRNHISGRIPENMSSLRQLASLDLSTNDLSGTIPTSLPSLSFLSYLNLSNNRLSGKIPSGGQMLTFGALAFAGNPGLCGAPVEAKCPGEDSSEGNNSQDEKDSNDEFIDQWFYLSIGLGFAAGILVPNLVLIFRKPWGGWYFDFVDKVVQKSLLRSTTRRRGTS